MSASSHVVDVHARPGRDRVLVLVTIALTVLAAGLGCSSNEDPPAEVTRTWQRNGQWPHGDVVRFDNVAVSTGPQTLSWFTRRSRGDGNALAYWEIHNGGDAVEIEVPTPREPVFIPVGVASGDGHFAAVAVTRETARGDNNGLMVWTGESGSDQTASDGETLPVILNSEPRAVSAAWVGETAVVAALLERRPALWSKDVDDPAWVGSRPSLDLDRDLVDLRVVGDEERFVLAGVDEGGAAHLWVSDDGAAWERLAGPPSEDVGAVGLLTPLGSGGETAVGWLKDEETAPYSATSATIQTIDGDDVSGGSVLAATGEAGEARSRRIDLGGATRSPSGQLVVVGAALRSSGTATPMVWVDDEDGDEWATTEQAELVGRLDHVMRAVSTTTDNTMIGLVTSDQHIDVESWVWRSD